MRMYRTHPQQCRDIFVNMMTDYTRDVIKEAILEGKLMTLGAPFTNMD